jgi:hypothetical protein
MPTNEEVRNGQVVIDREWIDWPHDLGGEQF